MHECMYNNIWLYSRHVLHSTYYMYMYCTSLTLLYILYVHVAWAGVEWYIFNSQVWICAKGYLPFSINLLQIVDCPFFTCAIGEDLVYPPGRCCPICVPSRCQYMQTYDCIVLYARSIVYILYYLYIGNYT